MSYKSVKRVLGETHLERKCRFIFFVAMTTLIVFAFGSVEYNVEKMVMKTIRSKGQHLTEMSLLKLHYDVIQNDEEFEGLGEEMIESLENQDYEFKFFAERLSDFRDERSTDFHAIAENEDLEILQSLVRQRFEALEAHAVSSREGKETQEGLEEVSDAAIGSLMSFELSQDEPPHIGVAQPEIGDGEYHYYQPIGWKESCFRCHIQLSDTGSLMAADAAMVENPFGPPVMIRVSLPYADVKDSINFARSLLAFAAILTVFLAVVALYVIVKYVVVKPLQHLRDVSDAISHGKTDLRAEINTGDEFEQLAQSFNRMLHHLTEAQGELKQVNTELDTKVDELAQLNMRLYEMNRLKDDFLANMSHELRTPLNSIIGFSEVLQKINALDEKQRRYAVNIQKSGRLLLEMINDILDLAKVEAGKMEMRPTEFQADVIINSQCDMVRSLTDERNIDLVLKVDGAKSPMLQDQAKVQQILTNLLSNAIKFTPEGGRITVSARRDVKNRLELIVNDTGVGILEEDRDVIFEKFRQSSSVLGEDGLTREFSGTGLGLSIVKELCKLLGGEISFTSEVGKGSTFRVQLPWRITERSYFETELAKKLRELAKVSSGNDEFLPHHRATDETIADPQTTISTVPFTGSETKG